MLPENGGAEQPKSMEIVVFILGRSGSRKVRIGTMRLRLSETVWRGDKARRRRGGDKSYSPSRRNEDGT